VSWTIPKGYAGGGARTGGTGNMGAAYIAGWSSKDSPSGDKSVHSETIWVARKGVQAKYVFRCGADAW
jgi:hypothetical protein